MTFKLNRVGTNDFPPRLQKLFNKAFSQIETQINEIVAAQATATAAAREAARINSYTVPTNVLTSADTGGGTAKIMVADHTRVYPVQGAIDVVDVNLTGIAAITGLANSTAYSVYYDDTTLSLATPAMLATTDPKVAQVGYAAGRHFVGTITTAAGGGGTTSGGGGYPPGGGGGNPIP